MHRRYHRRIVECRDGLVDISPYLGYTAEDTEVLDLDPAELAERLRRAKVISAEGEFQAADRLAEAARVMQSGVALQLRYLQTLAQIGSENNQTILFPMPTELLGMFRKRGAA